MGSLPTFTKTGPTPPSSAAVPCWRSIEFYIAEPSLVPPALASALLLWHLITTAIIQPLRSIGSLPRQHPETKPRIQSLPRLSIPYMFLCENQLNGLRDALEKHKRGGNRLARRATKRRELHLKSFVA